jgi:hypothetical protein
MKIEGIEFEHAYDFHTISRTGLIDYSIAASHPKDSGHGVYVVKSDECILYVGSYQSGVQKRWVFQREKDVYHFKKDRVAELISKGKKVHVYAQTLDKIKQQIGCAENPWVNAEGIEARLIAIHRPIWNKKGLQ